jgi:uncharacterized membrane protein
MQTPEFIKAADDQAIVSAIREAERRTSGEIRVVVSPKASQDPQADAFATFAKLGMHQTAERNGVLIFIAPASQNFAIIGDAGIHRCTGDPLWQEAAARLGAGFRESHFTEALVEAIGSLGEQLARHFPRRNDDRNELSDAVHRE